jgi:hypothetical protein
MQAWHTQRKCPTWRRGLPIGFCACPHAKEREREREREDVFRDLGLLAERKLSWTFTTGCNLRSSLPTCTLYLVTCKTERSRARAREREREREQGDEGGIERVLAFFKPPRAG